MVPSIYRRGNEGPLPEAVAFGLFLRPGLPGYTPAMKSRASRALLRPIFAAVLLFAALKFFVIDVALVDGPSMSPTFREGEPVLVFRLAYGLRLPQGLGGYLIRWSNPAPGDIVVAENPESDVPVIKRVAWTRPGPPRDGRLDLWLLGDNPGQSLDSRSYGTVPVEKVAGRVLLFPSRP